MKIPFTNLTIVKNEALRRGHSTKQGEMAIGLYGEVGMRVAPSNLWQIYRQNADVYSCIRELRQSTGLGGHRYVNPIDVEVDPERKYTALYDTIFANTGGIRKFSSLTVRDLGIAGNSYWEIVKDMIGNPWGLKRLDPRTMYVFADTHGEIIKYVQKVAGGNYVTFSPNEVIHVFTDDDPDDELFGMSPLETALWEARTDIASAQTNYYFFENDAVPGNLFIMEPGVEIADQQKFIDHVKAQFGGSKNRNKSAVLAGIKDVKQLSLSQKDMDFIVGRKFNTDKICSVYGVPKYVLGYTENVNYSSGIKLLEKFYYGSVKPLENAVMDAINKQMAVKLGVEKFIKFEFLEQEFGDEIENRKTSIEEFKNGLITMRQYKVKTGQDVSVEDEDEPFIDKHILVNGASAVLLSEVGVEPVVNPSTAESATNMLNALKDKYELSM